jgi:hypothetical protein
VFVVRVRRGFAGLVAVLVVGGVMFGGVSGASAIPTTPCGGGTLTLSGSTATCSYAAGVSDTFTVPAGVTQVLIKAVGGQGGAAYSGVCINNSCTFTLVDIGGSGAIVTSSVAVNPSDTLGVTVATDGAVGPGPAPTPPLYNGEGGSGAGNGGDGYKLFGSGGGGGSAVFSGAAALVVAGGGGGAGGCGDGGDAGQDAVPNPGCSSDIGFAATQTTPGAGSSLCAPNYPDAAGSGMNGGTGQGGGGGGGYFGGGAGCFGGGGGGSSYPAADVTGYDSTGTPSVTISYTVTPLIGTTQQPGSATVGSSIADQATVTGGDNPTGTVTFNLYSNSTGTGPALFTDADVALVSGVATSSGYTATATGTDYWVATYNGDSNNASVTSGVAAEPVTIKAAATSLTAAPQLVEFLPFAGIGSQVVQAKLTSGGDPVSGVTISFSVGSTPLCTAKTGLNGVARCFISPSGQAKVNQANSYTAAFAGNGDYLASHATTPEVVLF